MGLGMRWVWKDKKELDSFPNQMTYFFGIMYSNASFGFYYGSGKECGRNGRMLSNLALSFVTLKYKIDPCIVVDLSH